MTTPPTTPAPDAPKSGMTHEERASLADFAKDVADDSIEFHSSATPGPAVPPFPKLTPVAPEPAAETRTTTELTGIALRVETLDGKYTVQLTNEGRLTALRYNKPWRDILGDGLILTLAQDIETLQARLRELEAKNAELHRQISAMRDYSASRGDHA